MRVSSRAKSERPDQRSGDIGRRSPKCRTRTRDSLHAYESLSLLGDGGSDRGGDPYGQRHLSSRAEVKGDPHVVDEHYFCRLNCLGGAVDGCFHVLGPGSTWMVSASQLSTPPKPVGAVWSAARDKPGDRALTAAFISASRAPADNLPGCSYQTLKGSRDRARSTRREPSDLLVATLVTIEQSLSHITRALGRSVRAGAC